MISNLKHLAFELKIKLSYLIFILNNVEKYYRECEIDKKTKQLHLVEISGSLEKRKLLISSGQLKIVQSKIVKNLKKYIVFPNYIYGGISGKDNIKNAQCHKGKKYIFNTDIKKYFPSIGPSLVFHAFRSFGFSPDVSNALTKLTTINNQVPQGVPTSTFIANMVFLRIGNKLNTICESNKITFTSYVDDLTFSSNTDFKALTLNLTKIICAPGFRLKNSKTGYKSKPIEITGVITKLQKLEPPERIIEKLLSSELKLESKRGILNYIHRISIS